MDRLNFVILQVWISLLVLHNSHAKTCQTLELKNAIYHPGTNGYYDLTESRCSDRIVYEQRTDDENATSRYYMYYINPDGMSYGWTVGREICSRSALVYNWNNNKRPDYTLRYWIERDLNTWYYSFDLRVICTEGLKFGELIGVIIASIIAVPIISIAIYFIVKKVQRSKKNNRRTGSSYGNNSSAVQGDSSQLQVQPASVENGIPNYAFYAADGTIFPLPSDGNPQFPAMAPPLYEEVAGENAGTTSSIPVSDINANDAKPPTYEDVLAEVSASHARIVSNQAQNVNVTQAPTNVINVQSTEETENPHETVEDSSV